MQTVAAQSNLTIKGFKPAPTVTKQLHAEWPITLELEGTYHNLAIFFDRVGKFTRIVNISGARRQRQGQARAERHDHRDLRGDDVRAARQADAAPSRAPKRGRRRAPARARDHARCCCSSSRVALTRRRAVALRRRRRTPPAARRRPAGAAARDAAAPHRRRGRRRTPPPETYTYRADGRRDPFLNLIGGGASAQASRRAKAKGRPA